MKATPAEESELKFDDYVPVNLWGKDHWSTLLYFETVQVEYGKFTIKFDPRMRSNRRNFRILKEESDKPNLQAVVMDTGSGSRLKDGTFVKKHDDWCCIQDFIFHGLVDGQLATEPGAELRLTDKGFTIVHALRRHKANGGHIGTFTIPKVK
jgi:hypothetical protein